MAARDKWLKMMKTTGVGPPHFTRLGTGTVAKEPTVVGLPCRVNINEWKWTGMEMKRCMTDKIKLCSVSNNRLDWKIPSSLGGSGGESAMTQPIHININNKEIIW